MSPINYELSLQRAADRLNVSTQFLCELLAEGTIPYREVDCHRSVKLADLLDYKRRTGDARARVLDELAAQAQ